MWCLKKTRRTSETIDEKKQKKVLQEIVKRLIKEQKF